MIKPPKQTKEEIEQDLTNERWVQLQKFGMEMTANLMNEMEASEAFNVSAHVVGAILGNVVKLDEASMKEMLRVCFEIIEKHARATATIRANLEAITKATS